MMSGLLPRRMLPSHGKLAPAPRTRVKEQALPERITAQPVLVIEDEALLAWMLESLLEDLGFTDIVMAANGDDALRKLAGRRPGAIVSDINLGVDVPDGIDAVGMLPGPAGMPVVFVTAYANGANRARIAEAFPRSAIVAKPVAFETLESALLSALEGPAPN